MTAVKGPAPRLRRYVKKGRLVLSKRVVIDGRVFEPAIYKPTHAGPAPKDEGTNRLVLGIRSPD